MGNCCEKPVLKIIIETHSSKRVVYITSRQLRDIRNFGEFLITVGLSFTDKMIMYSNQKSNIEIIMPYTTFSIKNIVLFGQTETFIKMIRLWGPPQK